MNCQEFWKTMPENGIAHPHLRECAACAVRMRKQHELAAGLRTLAAHQARVEAPARVEAHLVAAFRAQAGRPSGRGAVRGWIPVGTWAAALAAMIAIGVFVVRDRAPEARRNPAKRVELASTENGFTATDTAAEEGYLPLPGAAQLVPSDDVSVVHVELPRSAMMQVGIEVNPERAGETVRADVMVGSDGLARAVRFVDVTGGD
ncbi:MAG TPA: hypothetical protein VNV86_14930 [Candidatus Acidoferrum sp.]|jgi:hypothetical protein|nr:hypothetical protein [Candidatus Acidoferrum sp.]